MAERVQLKEPGSELTITISKVEVETVENTEYYLFANGQKELLVPKTSVISQIDRLGVTNAAHLLGKTVRFSRSTKLSKYGKPFWNLDLAIGAEQSVGGEAGALPKPAGPASAPPPSTDHPSEKPRLDRIYLRSTKLILDEVLPLYVKAGIGCSDTALAAMVAALFIAASKVEAQ